MAANAKGTILVIDDEPDLLELVEFNLKKEGYETIVARNGSMIVVRETAKKKILRPPLPNVSDDPAHLKLSLRYA